MNENQKGFEYCCECDAPTGKGGASDGSLYTDEGAGPYCESCWGEYGDDYELADAMLAKREDALFAERTKENTESTDARNNS